MTDAATHQKPRNLSQDTIIDAAFGLIEREGAAGFSMRALGKELGVSAMALYGHFAAKDEIFTAMGVKLMDQVDSRPIPGERWDDTLVRTTRSYLDVMTASPQAANLVLGSMAEDAPCFAQHNARIVALHRAQGIPEHIMEQLWSTINSFMGGFVFARLWEEINHRELAGKALESQEWGSEVTRAYSDEAYANGINIIIQGVRGIAAPDPCEWRTPEQPA